jgi:hypothetical protein
LINNKDYSENFKLNKKIIYENVIKESNDCKKQSCDLFSLKKFNKSKKKLFHSIRILIFGIQILKFDKIIDFTEANSFFFKLNSSKNIIHFDDLLNSIDFKKYLKILNNSLDFN